MSLQVWLPLTKDLRQQGLSNVMITNNGATFNSAGKLGGCYSFDGVDDRISCSSQTWDYPLSICGWFKPTDVTNSNTQYWLSYNTASGGTAGHAIGIGTFSGKFGIWYGGTQYYSFTQTLSNNIWYHIAVTITANKTVSTYLNGELIDSRTFSSNNPGSSWFTLGARSNSSTGGAGGALYFYKGYMNDARLYDHALSQMEVKELAKGLVLHYPLNRQGWGQNNLIITNSIAPTSGTNGWSSAGTGWANSNVTSSGASNGHAIRCTYSGTTQVSGGIHHPTGVDKTTLTNGATYTLSARIRASKACIATFQNELMTTGNTINLTTDWKTYFYSCAIDNTKTYQSNVIYVRAADAVQNMWIECDWIKLEEGAKATPWVPNSAETLYTTMGLNSTTEYDCSGFCNNGEKTGTFTYTSDTPKYAVSTTLGNNTTKLHISGLSTTGFANSYSFAWWGKASTFSNMMQWGFSDGIRLNGIYNGTLWNTGDGSNNPLYNPGTTTQVTAPTTNVWHHYVMVGDGTTCKVYKDGVLWGQAKTYKAISGTSIYFNGWDSGTSYSHTNGYSMSDFRIYATALSADDVKSLYQNCATIDPDGTIRGQIRS